MKSSPKQANTHGERAAKARPTLMLVEVTGKSQDSLQKFFTERGFRTLLTQDPERALMRFKTWPRPDFLLISAQVLQQSAVNLFNHFSQDRYLDRVPVLMIGSQSQQEFFLAEAKTGVLRKILLMPFKANTLLQVVHALLAASLATDGPSPPADFVAKSDGSAGC